MALVSLTPFGDRWLEFLLKLLRQFSPLPLHHIGGPNISFWTFDFIIQGGEGLRPVSVKRWFFPRHLITHEPQHRECQQYQHQQPRSPTSENFHVLCLFKREQKQAETHWRNAGGCKPA